MTDKYDLPEKACFICGKWVENTDYPILPDVLETSVALLLPKVNHGLGKTIISLISEKEFLCQKCGKLMELMNQLESKLEDVKSSLAVSLNRRFKDMFTTVNDLVVEASVSESSHSIEENVATYKNSQDKFAAIEFREESPKEDSNAVTAVEEMSSTENGKYSCKICSFTSDSFESFKVHASSKHKFMCSVCREVFVSLEKVHCHIKENHLSRWTCQFCSKVFPSKTHYVNHTKLHIKGISEDSFCQLENRKKILSSDTEGPSHRSVALESTKEIHACKFCEFVTESKNVFDDHIRSHVVLKLFRCEECDLLFESKALLNEHEKVHKVMYKCGVCESSFESRECVMTHLVEQHKTHQSTEQLDSRNFRQRKQAFNNLSNDSSYEGHEKSSSVSLCNVSKNCNFEELNNSDVIGSRNKIQPLRELSLSSKVKDNESHTVSSIINGEIPIEHISKAHDICHNGTKESFVTDLDVEKVSAKEFRYVMKNHKDKLNVESETCLITESKKDTDKCYDTWSSAVVNTENESLNTYSLNSSDINSPVTKSDFKLIKAKGNLTLETELTEGHADLHNKDDSVWILLNSAGEHENKAVKLEMQSNENMKLSNVFVCGKCGYKAIKAHEIIDHLSIHNNIKLSGCTVNEESLINSLDVTHNINESENLASIAKMACFYCSWETYNKLELRNHISECHLNQKENFSCRYCRKKFTTKNSLSHHEESFCRNKMYPCKVCNKVFTRPSLLNKHRRLVHSSGKCCYCTKSFQNTIDLSKHKVKHEKEDGYQCLECPRIFKTKTGLKFHSAQHTGDYKFRCEYCGQGFMSRFVFQEHVGKHTKEERYVCDVCGRKFCFQSTYWIHRKWHDTPFPYKCDICERPFRHSSLLKVHKRQHTGERPYNCPHCSRSFSVSGTLKRHLMLHTGEYAFNCGECEKGFTTRSKYALHMSRVHGNDSMLQQGPPKTEFKMVIKDFSKSPKTIDEISEEDVTGQEMVVENYEELDSMMVQDGGIVGDGAELLKESGLLLPCSILNDVGGSIATRVVEILVNDETSQAVATVTVEGSSSLVPW